LLEGQPDRSECGNTSLEDEGVCELDVAGIAKCFDAGWCSDDGTQRQRRLLADVVKGSESHGGGGCVKVLICVLTLTREMDVRALQLDARDSLATAMTGA
jgi:hypothetical protein